MVALNKENDADMQTMSDAMASAGNYHQYLWEKIYPYLGDRVLEIGVGFGQYTRRMLNLGKTVMGIDISNAHLNDLKKTVQSANLTLLKVDISNPGDNLSQCREFSPHSILCMNILEHIEDDLKALETMHSLGNDDCKLLLLVPAMSSIFNSLDDEAGHFRRYNMKSLDNTLRQSGWETETIDYLNFPGVPGWLAAAFLGRFSSKGGSLNAASTNHLIILYDRLFTFLSTVSDPLFRKIAGLSLFVVARKKV